MKKFLSLLDGASLVALVVAMCSQVDVRSVGRDTLAEGLGYATKTLSIALSDVVFLLVTLYFVARVVQMRAWKRLWWPPLPCFALLFVLVLSALHSSSIGSAVAASIAENGFGPRAFLVKESKEAIAEIIQWSAYFLVAPWIFVNLLHDRRDGFSSRRNLALGAFVFATMASGIAALSQLQSFSQSAPHGFFIGSPNIYGAFLALALPLILEQESDDLKTQGRYWILSLVLVFIALSTVISIWAIVAMGIGFVVAVLARRGGVKLKAFRLSLVAALALVTLGFWRFPEALAPFRAESTRISSDSQKVKKQYVEWQAALGWSVPRERAFATGVGPGNYQLNIGPYYNALPNEEKMPPDSNNLWLVQAVSIGVLGLGALLWVVLHFWALAWRAAKQFPADWLGAGVCAALSSWIFVNGFHALIVRGAGLVLAFLFALAVIASQGERNADEAATVSNSL
ncbi:MAG TPA: hypothetical protein VGB45_06615 [Abditibacterium sp.]|jgi:hypothetical protein